MKIDRLILFCFLGLFCEAGFPQAVKISGELKTWHKVSLSIDGPQTSEFAKTNPFLNYRLDVVFKNGDMEQVVPGFYASDGNAAESSAEEGNRWQVRFRPDKAGEWSYTVHFKTGKDIAVAEDVSYGKPVMGDGFLGSFMVEETDKQAPDFRSKGFIQYTEGHYPQFSDGSYFLKGGADSPENFLAYVDFDQTYRYGEKKIIRKGEANPKGGIHKYKAHLQDWNEGDPSWQGGKGKAMIGAVNYLVSKGMNSIYMLTLNIMGDGKDVWPYMDHNERYRFDCSKLDQWEIVFDYMEQKGVMAHFVLQETENEVLLDVGHTDVQRKLYLRELIARFGHHLGVAWNLGEENGPAGFSPVGQTEQMKRDMANYIRHTSPYPNLIVLHTHASDQKQDEYLAPLLGFESIDGPSLQIGNPADIHKRVKRFVALSNGSGRKWCVYLDEQGQHWKGIMPDSFDAAHDTVRHEALWGAMMAGAAGVEWYFGHQYPHNDLECEDWRSRDQWWEQTRICLDFFEKYLPFSGMGPADGLVTDGCYCFANPGSVYAVYKPAGVNSVKLDLGTTAKSYQVKWFSPRNGGELQEGTVTSVLGGGKADIGLPPSETNLDWAVLVQ
tara:strand:+ start:18904 stop:20730 length:1827 start_codon:yes stop_codon:yes gene_type:complete